MLQKLLLLLFLALIATVSANGQSSNKDQIINTIETLFDGMRTNDSLKVASVFHEDAIMKTVAVSDEGEVTLQTGDLNGFLKAVGTPKEEVRDEQILAYNVQIDENLASVWTPYKFYVGKKFSHCGVNSFQLIKKDHEWKIFFIVDTRRTTGCEEL